MEEADDPYASLTKRCKPTASQEEILRTCPFSRQSEVFPGDSPSTESFVGIPVDSTGIVMVSPPDEFQTPPEDSLPTTSSEDQRPTAPTAVHGGEEDTFCCAEPEGKAVDLGKDSDNLLGFSEVNWTELVDGGDSSKVVDGVSGDFVADKELVNAETNNLVDDDGIMTEVVDIEVEEKGEKLGEDDMFVDLPLRETEVELGRSEGDEVVRNGNGDLGRSRKNIEDLDNFRCVSPSGVVIRKVTGVGGRRELPPSISKRGKFAGEETGLGNSAAKDKIFHGLLDALKMVAGQLDGGGSEKGDVDFLETAKRRGVTLPRPRWWPPEGYDD